jgi:hypothetical protein
MIALESNRLPGLVGMQSKGYFRKTMVQCTAHAIPRLICRFTCRFRRSVRLTGTTLSSDSLECGRGGYLLASCPALQTQARPIPRRMSPRILPLIGQLVARKAFAQCAECSQRGKAVSTKEQVKLCLNCQRGRPLGAVHISVTYLFTIS